MKYAPLICLLLFTFFYPSVASALIKTNNPFITGNATGWTALNGSGTNICGNTNSATETNFGTFSYIGSLSGQSAFRASGSSVLFLTFNFRGMVHQQLTVPGTGSVNVSGSFSYYAEEDPLLGLFGSNSSWIRLDVYNSANNAYVANLGCVVLSEAVPWTTTTPVNVTLSGGTTYTIRATLRSTVTAGVARTVTLGIDNIVVNVAPVGLAVAQPSASVELNWTTSTPGAGAPGLHTTQAYEIARRSSAGVTAGDIIASAATNSYADTGAVGNTTYWYALFDKDVNGTRSPVSSEVSILTKPTVPQNLRVEALDEQTLKLDWDAPAGGADSYIVQRAPDAAGAPGTYTNLATGVTNTSHTDGGHACGDTYWYRVIAVNTSGQSAVSAAVKGVTLYCISITLESNGTVDFGLMPLGTSRDSTAGGLNDPEVVKPQYGPVDLAVRTSNFTDGTHIWSFGAAAGIAEAVFAFSRNGTDWTTFLLNDHYYTLKANVAVAEAVSLFLRLTTPTESASLGPYNAGITIQASRP